MNEQDLKPGIYRTADGTLAYVARPDAPAFDLDRWQTIPYRRVDTTIRLRAAAPRDFYIRTESGRKH